MAFIVFIIVLAGCLFFLPKALRNDSPARTTTISTIQIETDSKGLKRRTDTTRRTVANSVPTTWERVFGGEMPFWVTVGLSLLSAFLAAAVVQRVLLGHYAISIGPLSVPEITAEQFIEAAESALSSAASPVGESETLVPEDGDYEQVKKVPRPLWMTVEDPNLALAGWRIELENELRYLAVERGIELRPYEAVGRLLGLLIKEGVIGQQAAPGLRELLNLANRGIHGAAVDTSVLTFLRTEGLEVLHYLQSLHRQS